MAKRLPPYGKDYFRELPRTGVQVAIGPHAWDFAERMSFIVMVLPMGADPFEFNWPKSDGAILHERGDFNDELLERMATALLIAGNPFVIARRSAMMPSDPVLKSYPTLDSDPDMNLYIEKVRNSELSSGAYEPFNLDTYPTVHGDPMIYFYPAVTHVAA